MATRDLTKCHKTKGGNVITAEGRMAYVSLFKAVLPKDETDSEKARYQTSIAFPKNADLSLLIQIVEACAVEKWGADYKAKFGKIKKPFLKTEDYPKMGLDPAEFPVFIRCNSPSRPQVVNMRMDVVTDDKSDQVYSGRWASVSVRPYAWDRATGKGVSLGLQNVQLLRDDTPLAAGRVAAEEEFEPVEGAGEATGGSDALFD